MTSPAFSTITQSPSRMSLRAMSSALCSVAIETVEPATNTGSSTANGVTAPVRPTLTAICLQQRRLLLRRKLERDRPARELARRARAARRCSSASTLMTTPSVSKSSAAALLGPLAAERDQRVDAGAAPPVRLDRQPPSPAAARASRRVTSGGLTVRVRAARLQAALRTSW